MPNTRIANVSKSGATASAPQEMGIAHRGKTPRIVRGREHGNLGQFIGRLHPLLVHGPVALIALVPLMELAGLSRRRAHLRSAAGWVLALAAFAAFAAAFDGWLLAWSGGLRGRDVTRHMWGGVWLAAACAAAVRARSAAARGDR